MSLYEGMFLMDNRQANRDWDGSLDSLKAIIAKHGGEIVRCDKWGERKLAYEVKGRRRGTYVLVYFNGQDDCVANITRECQLADLILRALVLKVSSVPPEEEIRAQAEGASGGRRGSRGPAAAPATAKAAAAKTEAKAAPAVTEESAEAPEVEAAAVTVEAPADAPATDEVSVEEPAAEEADTTEEPAAEKTDTTEEPAIEKTDTTEEPVAEKTETTDDA